MNCTGEHKPDQSALSAARSRTPPTAAARTTAAALAEQLHEHAAEVLEQIARVVMVLGPERTQELAREALAIHAGPGMLTRDGTRPRTQGGIFFVLVRNHVSNVQWDYIHPFVTYRDQLRHAAAMLTREEVMQLLAASDRWERGVVNRSQVVVRGNLVRSEHIQRASGQASRTVRLHLDRRRAGRLPGGILPPLPNELCIVDVHRTSWQELESSVHELASDELEATGIGRVIDDQGVQRLRVLARRIVPAPGPQRRRSYAPVSRLICQPGHVVALARSGETPSLMAMILIEPPIRDRRLPKDVPPATVSVEYLVLIVARHWPAIGQALANHAGDRLIVEGHLSYDPVFPAGLVMRARFAMTETQRSALRARRAAEQQQEPSAAAEQQA